MPPPRSSARNRRRPTITATRRWSARPASPRLPHWPVTVSYFEKGKGTDDAPTYVTSFVVYANGIGRKLRIDYGKFALVGHLTHLEMLPAPKC